MKSVLDEANDLIRKEYNQKLYLNTMDREIRAWLYTICKVMDKRLAKIKEEIEEKTFL